MTASHSEWVSVQTSLPADATPVLICGTFDEAVRVHGQWDVCIRRFIFTPEGKGVWENLPKGMIVTHWATINRLPPQVS